MFGRDGRPGDKQASVVHGGQNTTGDQRELQRLVRQRRQRSQAARVEPSAQSGAPLPKPLSAQLEGMSGIDMSDVRVHRNSKQPRAIGADAYAEGKEIHLGPGQETHLPHEAWHVVQQMQGRVQPTRTLGDRPVAHDEGLEREADQQGDRGRSGGEAPARSLQPAPSSFTAAVQGVWALLGGTRVEVEPLTERASDGRALYAYGGKRYVARSGSDSLMLEPYEPASAPSEEEVATESEGSGDEGSSGEMERTGFTVANHPFLDDDDARRALDRVMPALPKRSAASVTREQILAVLSRWVHSGGPTVKSYKELANLAVQQAQLDAVGEAPKLAPTAVKTGTGKRYRPDALEPAEKLQRLGMLRRSASMQATSSTSLRKMRDTSKMLAIRHRHHGEKPYSVGHTGNFLLGGIPQHTYEDLLGQLKTATGLNNQQIAERLIYGLTQRDGQELAGLSELAKSTLVKLLALIQGPEFRRAAINPTAMIAALNQVKKTGADLFTTLNEYALFAATDGGSKRSQFHRLDERVADPETQRVGVREYDALAELADCNDVDPTDERAMGDFLKRMTATTGAALKRVFEFGYRDEDAFEVSDDEAEGGDEDSAPKPSPPDSSPSLGSSSGSFASLSTTTTTSTMSTSPSLSSPSSSSSSTSTSSSSHGAKDLGKGPFGAPTEIEGVGRVHNVSGENMDCLIRSMLLSIHGAIDEAQVDILRSHLVSQGVAARSNALDLAGAAGAVLVSYMVAQGMIASTRGIQVYLPDGLGAVRLQTIAPGAAPINLWLSGEHFQAILP